MIDRKQISTYYISSIVLMIVLIFLETTLSAYYLQTETTPVMKYLVPITCNELTSGIEDIDAIYMINLDRRPDRLMHMNRLFDAHHLHVNRVSAYDGEKLSDEMIRELVGPYTNSCLLRFHQGALGCLLSHISVAYDACKREFNFIYVLEDDVEVLEDLKIIPQMIEKLSTIDPEWDIFYTDPDFRKSENKWLYPLTRIAVRPDQPLLDIDIDKTKRKIRQTGNQIDRVYYRWGTHSMIISARGLKKMVNHFLYTYLYSPIDVDIHAIPEIREYSAVNPIVTNGLRFTTDIRKKKKLKNSCLK